MWCNYIQRQHFIKILYKIDEESDTKLYMSYIFQCVQWIFAKVLDLLLPARYNKSSNGSSADRFDEFLKHIHLRLAKMRKHSNVQYALRYKESDVKNLIWKFKYFLNPEALRICTYILYDQLVADVSDRVNLIPFQTPHLLLHYPSSTYFKGKKKFDHMKELMLMLDSMQRAQSDTSSPFFTCCTHAVLPNHKSTEQAQHTGSRVQRFKWSKERFILSNKFEAYMENHPEIRHVYCIDDVVTTGASMQAVSKMLEEKFHVEVIKFCICH